MPVYSTTSSLKGLLEQIKTIGYDLKDAAFGHLSHAKANSLNIGRLFRLLGKV